MYTKHFSTYHQEGSPVTHSACVKTSILEHAPAASFTLYPYTHCVVEIGESQRTTASPSPPPPITAYYEMGWRKPYFFSAYVDVRTWYEYIRGFTIIWK